MQKHKIAKQIVSMLLTLVMMFTLIPMSTVFAADDIHHGDGTGSDGGTSSRPNVWNGEEGIRVTLLWVPLKPDGKPDWDSKDNIVKIGKTVDMRSPKYSGLTFGIPTIHGDFTDGNNSARAYRMDKLWNPASGSAYNNAGIENLIPGKIWAEFEKNSNSGAKATLKFPILFTSDKNDVEPVEYFRNVSVQNQVLYKVQDHIPEADRVQYKDLASGMRKDSMGTEKPGQYIEILEPVLYGKNRNDGAFGYTLREIIRVANSGSSIYTDFSSILPNMANSLYIKQDWPMLNLWGDTGYDAALKPANNGATNRVSSISRNAILVDQKFGVGIIEFTAAKKASLPVINYYYDLKQNEVEWATDDTGNQVAVSSKLSAFDRKADNAEPLTSSGDYTAPAKFTPTNVPNAKEYTLIKGYIANTDANKGYLDAKKEFPSLGLTFWTKPGNLAELSPEVTNRTGITDILQVKNWNPSEKLKTDETVTLAASKITSGKHLTVTPESGIQFKAGEGSEKLQAVFLYVRLPDSGLGGTLISGGFPLFPTPDELSITEKRILPPTNVTKMFYDVDPVTKEEKLISIDRGTSISKESTYTIKGEENGYKLKEWTLVDDKTPSVSEPYYEWSTVISNTSPAGKSGTTAGSLGPTNWNDPDRELFIKYTKEPLTPEILPSELYLPERRISWHKSLADLGGVPTITFKWAAITGYETHYDGCGSEDSPCPGHPCNESIGSDNFFRFVASNLTAVKSDIMGNKTNFMPYDKDNVYETTRGNSEGTYEMHPDYGFVIWRGKDIPTIASYKYGDTTGSGTATSAPIIKNLIGETQAGISGKGARNPNNNGSYTDSFSINEGKSNYDTGNMTGFIGSFGGDRGTADGVYEGKINDFHTVSTQLKADIKALSEAESQLPTKN